MHSQHSSSVDLNILRSEELNSYSVLWLRILIKPFSICVSKNIDICITKVVNQIALYIGLLELIKTNVPVKELHKPWSGQKEKPLASLASSFSPFFHTTLGVSLSETQRRVLVFAQPEAHVCGPCPLFLVHAVTDSAYVTSTLITVHFLFLPVVLECLCVLLCTFSILCLVNMCSFPASSEGPPLLQWFSTFLTRLLNRVPLVMVTPQP